MNRLHRALAADERGTSLVEMGLLAPFLSVLVIGTVDIARGYNERLKLEQAAHVAIEKVQGHQSNSSTYTTLRDEAVSAAQMAGFTNTTAADVTITYWLECNGVKQTGATMDEGYNKTCTPGQTYQRWLQIEITQVYTPYFSMRWAGSNANGTFTLKGKAGMRTQ
jgi:Flp pilus assembly protein TadG